MLLVSSRLQPTAGSQHWSRLRPDLVLTGKRVGTADLIHGMDVGWIGTQGRERRSCKRLVSEVKPFVNLQPGVAKEQIISGKFREECFKAY
jgi:hypothetical protein